MYNYMCLSSLLSDNKFDIEHLIKYYISYVSVFYCKDIEYDEEIKSKLYDLEECIKNKL